MVLKYTNYDDLNIDEELSKIENSKKADIILEPTNKDCLFVLGMLFANGIKIKIINEKDLNLEETNKSFSMMPYVWSKIGDKNFPLKDCSNVVSEMDKRIENIKRVGVRVEKLVNKPIKNKIFLICPVRNATDEQRKWIENFVSEKTKKGYIIHAPHLHTKQTDLFGGYAICKQNGEAVASSSEIDMYYDQSSTGSVFDLGVAYALHKPLKVLNEEKITYDKNDSIDNIVKNWPYKQYKVDDIKELKSLLLSSWNSETCSPGLREFYSKNNPSLGQCAITALIVNDMFGGKIMRCMASTGSHYYNLIDDNIVDLTVEQFLGEIPRYEDSSERSREYLLSNEDTKKRYLKLMYNLRQVIRQLNGKEFLLLGGDGKYYTSSIPGTLGGNKKLKIYGKLDCPSANRWIDKGMYVQNRVFFANEEDAINAGYRPCAVCMKEEYIAWKNNQLKKVMKKKENI